MSRYWESICRRCGLCCMEKTIVSDRVIYHMDRPCVHLDTARMSCSIYKSRFTDCSHCRKMTLWKALFAPYLPESCGYVQWAKRLHIRCAPSWVIVYIGDESEQ